MAFASLLSRNILQYISPVITCCDSSSPIPAVNPRKHHICLSRRAGTMAMTASTVLATEAIFGEKAASGFEFRMTVPGQTVEEAESVLRDHAQSLLDVKSLIEIQSWRKAQRELRKNSAYLKQDIYTIIQSKEGSTRPMLRKLYFNLFNNVSKLDYAARDQDAVRVQKCYDNVVASLDDILSKI